jgi:hypothetical protein
MPRSFSRATKLKKVFPKSVLTKQQWVREHPSVQVIIHSIPNQKVLFEIYSSSRPFNLVILIDHPTCYIADHIKFYLDIKKIHVLLICFLV